LINGCDCDHTCGLLINPHSNRRPVMEQSMATNRLMSKSNYQMMTRITINIINNKKHQVLIFWLSLVTGFSLINSLEWKWPYSDRPLNDLSRWNTFIIARLYFNIVITGRNVPFYIYFIERTFAFFNCIPWPSCVYNGIAPLSL